MKFTNEIAQLVMNAIFGAQLNNTLQSNQSYVKFTLYYKKPSSGTGSDSYVATPKEGAFISTPSSSGSISYNPAFAVLNNKELYLGLCTQEPEVNSSGAVIDAHEINSNTQIFIDKRNYERIRVTDKFSTNYMSYAQGDSSKHDYHYQRIGNTEQLTFTEALRAKALSNAEFGGNWTTASYWAIWPDIGYTEDSSGNRTPTNSKPFVWGELEEPVTTETHEIFIIRDGHMEVYLEPDMEYMYYGAYTSMADFKTALTQAWYIDAEGVSRPNPTFPTGLHRIEGKNSRGCTFTITLNPEDVGKYIFFAAPVDYKGTPMFRDTTETLDANGDYQYIDYAYITASETVYTGADFSDTDSQGLTPRINIPEFITGAPPFTGTVGDGRYIGPFYSSPTVENPETNEPANWGTTYTNYYYNPSIVKVNRETAFFMYQIMSGIPTVVTDPTGQDPSAVPYYEVRNKKVKQFVVSSDTSPVQGKTYYEFHSPASPTWQDGQYSIRVF